MTAPEAISTAPGRDPIVIPAENPIQLAPDAAPEAPEESNGPH